MSLPKAIIFDLDGTLVDTAADLLGALNHTLGEMSVPPIEEKTLRHMVGQGARRLIEQALASAGLSAPLADIDAGLVVFLDYYKNHIADQSAPFPGTIETLEKLREAGVNLGICTNKPQGLTKQLVAALAMDHLFDAVVGADIVANRKPHADHIIKTASDMDADLSQTVMVGDSENDVQAARNAAIPIIAVSFGYTSTPANELGADAVIDTMSALPQALESLSDLALRR